MSCAISHFCAGLVNELVGLFINIHVFDVGNFPLNGIEVCLHCCKQATQPIVQVWQCAIAQILWPSIIELRQAICFSARVLQSSVFVSAYPFLSFHADISTCVDKNKTFHLPVQ